MVNLLNIIITVPLLCFLLSACSVKTSHSLSPKGFIQKDTIHIENGNLKAVFVDNKAYGLHHRRGYNGIAELYHRDQDSTIFVPFYAGFNLEHIFGGDSLPELFEPRLYPMQLFKKSKNEIILYQAPTPRSGTESRTTFSFNSPDYIDINVECIFRNKQFFRHGYAGLFWASYIHQPQDKNIYFIGTKEGRKETSWITAYSSMHGLNSTHPGVLDTNNFFFAKNFNATLANHFSLYRYAFPYYFGRFGNMVLAFLFKSNEIIRFSQSPTGGGPGCPAWDFQFIIPSPKYEKKYSFKVRMIYKPFINETDIKNEYSTWKKNK